MRSVEFVVLRHLANMSQRPNIAFGMLMAMRTVGGEMYPERIASLLGTSSVAVSAVGKELSDMGYLTRTWTESRAMVATMGDHGRKRLYALVPNWFDKAWATLDGLQQMRATAGQCSGRSEFASNAALAPQIPQDGSR